jgi:hypothetical protein
MKKLLKNFMIMKGKVVVIYYEEYLVGWPEETNYNVTAWNPKDGSVSSEGSTSSSSVAEEILSKTFILYLIRFALFRSGFISES